MLRPALELALAVARAGPAEDPPVQPPRALRPILGFNRLPASAGQVVLRALDQDAAFRTRVAAAASQHEATLGRASWLFLVRPEGWEGEVEQLRAAAADASAAGAQEREERSARRRLRGAQEAAQRAEEQLAQARAELGSANAALGFERQARRQAEAERDELRRRVGSLQSERDAAHRRAAAATTESAKLTEQLREHQARLLGLQGERIGDQARPEVVEEVPGPSAPPVPEVRLAQVRRAVQEAAAAASRLGAALGAAAQALGERDPGEAADPLRAAPVARAADVPSRPPERRLPLPLPPGLLEESTEAAEFLVRAPGMLVVVDGYNASLRRWPEHPITEQRRRLVQALAALSARSGCEVHVVFDGAGALARGPSPPRGGVRVTFSPAGVEADDLILDLVDQAPAHRPVAVASDDRRVRREAAARGANGLSQGQLFAVAGLDS